MANPNRTDDRLLTPTEAAEFLGVSRQTLAKWRCLKSQPLRFTKAGRLVRYFRSDLEAYADSRACDASVS